ncbi:MAG: helix-turn-helix domain-containing protein [Actinomycetaceae bacterium]|nr:helix-turn-helix domain-containing protein [Actinomycetaceae bacterium]
MSEAKPSRPASPLGKEHHYASPLMSWADSNTDAEIPDPTSVDLATLGARIRHMRQSRNMTLATLAEEVNRAPSLLSQIENGKREPKVSLLSAIAQTLDVSIGDLMKSEPPSERAAMELALKSAQNDPRFASWNIPEVYIGPRLPTDALKALIAAYKQLDSSAQLRVQSPEAARVANVGLRAQMRELNNYFPEIEAIAKRVTNAVGHKGGPLLESGVTDIANYLGFQIHRVEDLPHAARSVADLRNRRIYLPVTSRGDKDLRMVILRSLADHALQHRIPTSFSDFLRQRVESNYFASAVLMPEEATVAWLKNAYRQRDLALSDLRDYASVRYEAAVHRFTNLCSEHLDMTVHFMRVGRDGIIYKAYANDGLVLPTDASGAIEGQLACREMSVRRVFEVGDPFAPHYQYTDTPVGTFFSICQVERTSAGDFAIGFGVPFEQSRYFRGRDTAERRTSMCPDPTCCRQPPAELSEKWANYAWPSVRAHSHLLAAVPPGAFPGLDDRDVYEFLERHSV